MEQIQSFRRGVRGPTEAERRSSASAGGNVPAAVKLRSRPTLRALDGFEHTGVACETQEIQSGVFSEFLSAGFVLKNFFPNSSSLLAGHFELLRNPFAVHSAA
jgi:hypothetical protein